MSGLNSQASFKADCAVSTDSRHVFVARVDVVSASATVEELEVGIIDRGVGSVEASLCRERITRCHFGYGVSHCDSFFPCGLAFSIKFPSVGLSCASVSYRTDRASAGTCDP